MPASGLNPVEDEGGPEYTATSATNAQFGGYTVVHEICDTERSFRHRVTIRADGVEKSGNWMDYPSFAYVEHNEHKYFCSMDNWEPMFPEFFEVVGPYTSEVLKPPPITDISATQPVFEDPLCEDKHERSSN